MPELPEILILARQMNDTISGEVIKKVIVQQPKCLNVSMHLLRQINKKKILNVAGKGKWLILSIEHDWMLLLNLGMGGDIIYFHHLNDIISEKYQARVDFYSDSGFTVKFWWFGHIHMIRHRELSKHPAGQLGLSPLDKDFTLGSLEKQTRISRRNIKSLLKDQRVIAGIGNAYIHDILFLARIHPKTQALRLNSDRIQRLHAAIQEVFSRVLSKNGLAYERDFFGRYGGFEEKDFIIGYHEGQPCPICGNSIQKTKIAGSSSYICPSCQKF